MAHTQPAVAETGGKKEERERERDHEGLLPNVSSEMKLGQRHCIFGTSAQGILKRFGREKVWGDGDGFLFAIFRRVHLSSREERRGEERRGEERRSALSSLKL